MTSKHVDGKELKDLANVETITNTYSDDGSFQALAGDLNLATGASGSFLAGAMGNVLGDALADTGGYVAGVIGSYNITTSNATTNPCGGVIGEVGDLAANADGAVVAVLGGDSGTTTAGAAFKVMNNNSTAASGFDFGLDLQDAAHDGYQPVDSAFYLKSEVRLTEDVCVKVLLSGTPVDGTSGTGAGVCGPGSLLVAVAGAKLYINTNTKASPTWTVVGAQT